MDTSDEERWDYYNDRRRNDDEDTSIISEDSDTISQSELTGLTE